MSQVFVGTSGYSYLHWKDGVFYPPGVRQREWLEYYAQTFNSVELNVTFYRLPKKEMFAAWREKTPRDFVFAVKGSRFITHIKRLKDCREPLRLFFGNLKALKQKLKVVLWQFPPGFHLDIERLEGFLRELNKLKAAKSARQSFEFRHPSWFCNEAYDLLKKHKSALCIAHSGKWHHKEVVTADFIYLRFHGGEVLYGSEYSDRELKEWAGKAKTWLGKAKDIYAYFNNDAQGYAVKNALRFKQLLLKQ